MSPDRALRGAGLLLLVGLLLGVCFLSIVLGTRGVSLATIWHAFTAYDPASASETVIRQMRVPRTLIGLSAGVAVGLAGALLQASTRNPLADPGLLGINAGAAAAIVTAVAVLGPLENGAVVGFGFVGAAGAVLLVYSVASLGREGATPVKLALVGASVAAGLGAVVSAVVLTNLDALNEMRFWQVGSLAGRYWSVLFQTLPFIAVGSILALASGRLLNALALGDELATGLGMNVARTRLVIFATVALLAGASVAACGPVVFLGLAVPQAARALVGTDWRWVLAYTAVLSPIVMLAADIVGRLVLSPGELQVGVVLGVVGAPVFVLLVRSAKVSEL